MDHVVIVGGGLAGSEAAWQLVRRGIPVCLYEMRPVCESPAHQTDRLGELVCSNSLGSDDPNSAGGLLKEELRRMDSLIMKAADASTVPAGKALAVDRNLFSAYITETLTSHPLFTLKREEINEIPSAHCIIASGPLTSPALASELGKILGGEYLYFFDAVAPVIELDSVNMEIAYRKDRYAEYEGGDYINCPMNEQEYQAFYEALISAQRAPLHDFEGDMKYFEGCMPVEVIASRGRDTLRFGPMRPVGLENPRTGRRPYAAVQIRQDNREGTLYNIVGFQTNLRWGEQQKVFRMIPGLENAEFVRMGVMHRNIYVNAPRCLDGHLRPRGRENMFLAGQLTGVEGYVESTAMGCAAALGMYCCLGGQAQPDWPAESAVGALLERLRDDTNSRFSPTNANMGIFPSLGVKIKNKSERAEKILSRGRERFSAFMEENARLFVGQDSN
ncbi:MAG: methylenetetrahydrofolate--tRNA-(uracil(54)-C(5))-methyltransferase (FADH(2)-oxidizing) TrmFO [Pyramidobacter sp.]|nr:methylenetetrahydrofolate--tRNA-(uracil(54)-C(5))-methyltransferase (FADH(2)-oxidizing) TrmFO [Pyramidobacter sp.]